MKKLLSAFAGVALLFCCGAAEDSKSFAAEGKKAQAKGDYAAAIAAYQKAATLATRPYEKYSYAFKEQECLCRQKKYDDAIAVMQKALKIEKLAPEHQAEALYLCGQAAYSKKDFAAAQKYYTESGNIGKGWASARSWSNLGEMLRRQNKLAEAEASFNKATKRNEPGSRIEALIGLSQIYMSKGKSEKEVMTPLEEAEKIAVKQNHAQNKLSVIYYKTNMLARLKKSDAAIAEAMRVKEFKNPQRDWVASIYSCAANVAYSQKKDMKLAKELIDLAAAQKPSWGLDKNLQKKLESLK